MATQKQVCPSCQGPLVFDHKDDAETEWFKCQKCGQQTSKPITKTVPQSEPESPAQEREKSPALAQLKENFGYSIQRTHKCYVLFNETWQGSREPIYTFKDPTSEKVKRELEKQTEAPSDLIEKVVAELSLEHGKASKNVEFTVSDKAEIDVEPVTLEHLTMIENPTVADLPVIVEGVVSSTSISYLVPKTIQVFITDKNGVEDNRTIEIGEKNPVNIKFCGINEDIKYRRLKRYVEEAVNEPGSKLRINEDKMRTIYKIRVRPPVFTLEKREGKIVDEKGYEYKSYDIYVCTDKLITFEASSLVRLTGVVLPNPHNQNTTLLVYEVEFPEEFRSFDMEKLDKLKGRFKGWMVQQRVDWILSNFEKYSQIIGRRNLAFEGFLAFFTPCTFN